MAPIAMGVDRVADLTELTVTGTEGVAGGRTAMVFSSAAAYGLGRIFEQLRQVWRSPVETKPFRDRAKALAWLNGE